jgi:tRNA(Ile)-lysidine synthase
MRATEQKIIRFINENKLIESGDKILVALSGGPDSVFLLHFLNKYKKKYKIELSAAHINHLLRGKDSERDEIFCKTICDELNIPFYSTTKNVKAVALKNKQSVEIAGRKIRYDFFNKLVKQNNFSKIATAHNTDDNTETVFLNLIKGTGLKGIAGIPVKRGNIIRPVLCLCKFEILEYLEANQFEYRIDESNLSNEYERNFLRNEIIPLIKKNLNPALDSVVLNTSINLQKLVPELDKKSLYFEKEFKFKKNSSLAIPVSLINLNSSGLSSLTIKNKIENNFDVKIKSSDIRKIFALASKQTGKSEQLSNNLILLRERDKILVKKNAGNQNNKSVNVKIGKSVKIGNKVLSIKIVPLEKVKMNKSKNIEYIDGEKIVGDFILRNWQEGDKFKPIGMNGTKKISDYLNDIKVSSFEKKCQLILENQKNIVWVIGKRIDDRFKISNHTKKVLELCLK